MAGYIGEIGKRIKTQVTLTGDYEYQTKYMWQTQYHHIYTMVDDQDHVLVWKTTGFMGIEGTDDRGNWWSYGISKGDRVEISATVKDHGDYNGQEQTEVQRLKVNKLIEKAVTKEEQEQARKQEQMDSIKEDDMIWRMPYKQYKEHYSDCETVIGSYESDIHRGKSIEVIIRAGRLKASGVRGEHFSGYCLQNELGEKITYRAVSEENALKRVQKDFPEHTWEVWTIYKY